MSTFHNIVDIFVCMIQQILKKGEIIYGLTVIVKCIIEK